jgi:hypothetical protein
MVSITWNQKKDKNLHDGEGLYGSGEAGRKKNDRVSPMEDSSFYALA